MESGKQLAVRVREVLLDGKWIANVNFKEHIENTNWKEASTKINDLNTIADLTFHINYYLGGVLNVFEGGQLEIRDKYSFDTPSMKNQKDWDLLINSFLENAKKFTTHVENMDDKKLAADFVDPKYGDYRRNIEAMIEHAYYHLGQVSILKKMISNWT